MTDVAVPPPAPTPSFVGQATAVEQSRAVAEVQAAVVVARQNPRSTERALAEMRESFKHHALADRSFFAYRRGGSNITGPTIHMARELGRLWENVQWGINELRRDDVRGESEMIAWAWDLQANIRSSTTFIVKHARDRTGGGRDDLTSLRDIYENNANNGSRRVREMIFAVLPAWFVDEAKELARKTLADGGGVPLPARRANTIKAFGGEGITESQLIAKYGAVAEWGDVQLANMSILGRSIRDGETTVAEAFPRETERVTVDQLAPPKPPPAGQDEAPASGPPAGGAAPEPSDPEPERARSARPATGPQKGKIKAAAKLLGLDEPDAREEYLAIMSEAVSRPVTSSNDLTYAEALIVEEFLRNRAAKAPNDTAGERGADALTGLDVDQLRDLAGDRAKSLGWSKPEFLRAVEDQYHQPFDDLDAEQLRRFVTGLTFQRIVRPVIPADES